MGVATTIFRIPHSFLANASPEEDKMVRVREHVDFLLQILPKGTVFVKCIGLNIVDLSLPYSLSFLHPWFDDGTTFEDNWIRASYTTDPPENGLCLHQFNVFMGISYKFPEGSDKVFNE